MFLVSKSLTASTVTSAVIMRVSRQYSPTISLLLNFLSNWMYARSRPSEFEAEWNSRRARSQLRSLRNCLIVDRECTSMAKCPVHITKAFSFSLITSSSIASLYLLKLICAPCHQQWVTIAQTLCVIHQISKFLLQYDHKLCKYGLNCGQSQLRVYTEQFGAFNLFNRPFVCSVIYSFCSHRSCDCLLARAITRCYRSFVCIAWLKTNIARLDSEAHLNGIQQQKLHRSERIAKCYL